MTGYVLLFGAQIRKNSIFSLVNVTNIVRKIHLYALLRRWNMSFTMIDSTHALEFEPKMIS